MDTLPVTLIVKAPNHAECEDHTVKCELSWTIRRLKGHLSELYPCKPEEQKLIYSGQLLQDAVVLKDVLRQYDGQETHTVHLVYTPKQQFSTRSSMDINKDPATAGPATGSSPSSSNTSSSNMSSGDSAMSANNDGLRRRNVSSSAHSGDSLPQQQQQSANSALHMNLQAMYSQPFTSPPTIAGMGAAPVTSEQIVAYQQWYQQQYMQYVHHYMAYMNTLQQQATTQTNTQPQMQWPEMMPGYQAFLPFPGNTAGVGVMPTAATATAPATQAGTEQVAGDQPQQQQGAVAAPRFPMMVHEPDRPERDWLDHVNTFCRITFLLLMIYFYSSALRFAIVMCAVCAVFVYRNRRTLLGAERAAPAAVAPPAVVPAPPQPAANEPVPEAANGDAAPVAAEVANAEDVPLIPGRPDNNNNNVDLANRNGAAAATNGQEQNNPPTTVLSFMRTFVTSFFYSLLPEPAMAP